jgi:hypothetical protein
MRPIARASLLHAGALLAVMVFAQDAPDSSGATSAPRPTVQQIVEQQTQLRGQVAGKRGAFKDMHEGDRHRLLAQQDELLKLLDGRQSFDELRAEQRVEVFNILQNVNAAATKAEDERQVCERSRLVGTNRFQVVCMSGRQYREHKENAKQSLRTVMKCQGADSGSMACKSN